MERAERAQEIPLRSSHWQPSPSRADTPSLLPVPLPASTQLKDGSKQSPTVLELSSACTLGSALQVIRGPCKTSHMFSWLDALSQKSSCQSFYGDLSADEAVALVKEAPRGSFVCYTQPGHDLLFVTWLSRQPDGGVKTCRFSSLGKAIEHMGISGMRPLTNHLMSDLCQQVSNHPAYRLDFDEAMRTHLSLSPPGTYCIRRSSTMMNGSVWEIHRKKGIVQKLLTLPAPDGSGWCVLLNDQWQEADSLDAIASLLGAKYALGGDPIDFDKFLSALPSTMDQDELVACNTTFSRYWNMRDDGFVPDRRATQIKEIIHLQMNESVLQGEFAVDAIAHYFPNLKQISFNRCRFTMPLNWLNESLARLREKCVGIVFVDCSHEVYFYDVSGGKVSRTLLTYFNPRVVYDGTQLI